MENFFDLLDLETQEVIRACANEVTNDEINQLLANSCEDSHMMDFMFGGNETPLYTVTSDTTRENKKFKCEERTIQLKASNKELKSFEEAVEFCHNYIESIHSKYVEPLDENTRIRTVIQHDEFNSAINFPFMKKKDLTARLIFKEMDKVIQSRKNIKALTLEGENRATISFIIAQPISGSGKRKGDKINLPSTRMKLSYVNNNKEYDKAKQSIKEIFNTDNYCLIRAIIIAIAYYENDPSKIKMLDRPTNRKLMTKVLDAVKACKIEGASGINDLINLEAYFKDYQIMLIDASYKITNKPLYLNQTTKFNKYLYLFHTGDHYNVIESMPAYVNKAYYCDLCKIGFDHTVEHSCVTICKACQRMHCRPDFKIKCQNCDLFIQNKSCFDLHDESKCQIVKKCPECMYFISRRRPHICGDDHKWCTNCNESVDILHKCHIRTEEDLKLKAFEGFIFFDFESYLNEDSEHIVNLAMAQKVCKKCVDLTYDQRCEECNKKYIFYNLADYCDWAMRQKNTVQIAHNLKGYDGVFILKYFLENLLPCESTPEVILTGCKILAIMHRQTKIIDSYSFLTMALSEFPKTFGISELKKGFFPHKFNLPGNQNYIGTYPPADNYQSEFFNVKKKKEFDQWYDSVKDQNFDFKKEFEDYCWSDVRLLAEGCLIFRKCCIESTKKDSEDTGIDPFLHNVTIASFCNLLYRRNFMPKDSIAIIPENGYHPEQKQSKKALIWMKEIAEKRNINIRHKGHVDGEFKVGPFYVDGIDLENKTIFEFHGCWHHACPKCFSETTFNKSRGLIFKSIYIRHKDRLNYIKEKMPDYKIEEIWEHDWDGNLNEIVDEIIPREALSGGHTMAFNLYYKCIDEEKIKYIDYTSLYPYVQKYGIYPKGHPEIITENFSNKKYFGLIKCKIIAPRGLYHPVLPAKINNKLKFPLCAKCAATNQKNCNHNDNERALVGTWVSLEVDKAIEKGYRIEKYFCVWHWNETLKYDEITKTGGLFTGYINNALKEKQEASGFPQNCDTEEKKDKYIQDYYQNEGILLDKNNIEFNPGKRAVAKIKANSQWGYLAMNNNKVSYKIINDAGEWFKLLENDQYKIHDVKFFNQDTIQVFYSHNKDQFEGGIKTNVAVAAFVTAQGRLHLYNEMEKLDKRVLYCDTDSIIFISRPGEYEPELGNYLGQFTNEIEDGYIEEFVSAGPKNYAYKLNNGKTNCTIKGFTQNHVTSLKLTYESIKNIVCENQNKKIPVDQLKFVKNKKQWTIKTNIEKKNYGFVYDKRALFEDLTTLPFGY